MTTARCLLVAASVLVAGPLHAQDSFGRRAEPQFFDRTSVLEAGDGFAAAWAHAPAGFQLGFLGGAATGAGIYMLTDLEEKGFALLIGGPLVAYAGAELFRDPRAAAWGFGLGLPAAIVFIALFKDYD